jgi:hypothetical protein
VERESTLTREDIAALRVDVRKWQDPVVVGSGGPPAAAGGFVPGPSILITAGFGAGATAGLTGAGSVLAGDGGTGKTQLAVATWQAMTGRDEPAAELAVWVPATSRSAIQTGLAAAGRRLHLPVPEGDVELQAVEFLTWLSETGRSWLVVLDDVADP